MSFLVTVVLARILMPEDFGLIGLIAIFITMGSVLIDSGMGSSLIRDIHSTDIDFNTVFCINLCMSILLYGVLFVSAPHIAEFYNKDLLSSLIRVFGLNYIISAFWVTQQTILIKNLKFKKLAFLNIPSTILSGAIAIIMALYGYGVWSLVGLYLSNQIIKTLLIWYKSEWVPRLQFSKSVFNHHFNYGYKLVLSGLLGTITKGSYALVIGKQFDVASVGYYTRANSLKNYPVTTIGGILNRITFPILSKIKEDKLKLSKAYQSILKVSFFVMTGTMVMLIAIAKPLFLFLFTEKWSEAISYFQILALAGMLVPINSFNLNVFKIYGRTDIILKLSLLKNALAILSLFIGVYFGIFGLLWAFVITSIISLFINSYSSADMIGYSTLAQLKDMIPVIIVALISYLVVSYILILPGNISNIFQIILGSLSFIILYVGINLIAKTDSIDETIKMIGKIKSKV